MVSYGDRYHNEETHFVYREKKNTENLKWFQLNQFIQYRQKQELCLTI